MKLPQIGERQWVTIGIFAFACLLLGMAAANPSLWGVEVFKVIIQAVVLTGLLNMVLAFHFASNKGSETARENTGAAFRAIEAAANAGSPPPANPSAGVAAQDVADAAQDQADTIKDGA
jgi:hypothetical protein